MKTSRALVAISLLPLLTACEGWEDFELDPYLPTVTFENLEVLDVDWDGVEADFVFNVNNPNPIDVNLARFDYGLAFQEVEWLNGDDPDGLTLGASGSSELALPVSFKFQDLYDLVQAVRGQDNIDFGLQGSFGFDTPAGPIDLPYAEAGDFPAPRKPGVSLNSLKVQDISFSGADLNLRLDVDNSHGSALGLAALDYDLSLAGIDLGSGYIADLGRVDGDSQTRLAIPVHVDFLGGAAALYSVLQGEKLDVDLRATLDVDTPFGVLPLTVNEFGQVNVER
ncbi:MAG: LEA14-like dessication related protein [Cognaticolwellia sp.]|jgi:LEA14-like dessication related protein